MNFWISRRYERQMMILAEFLESLGATCYFNDECTLIEVELGDRIVMSITRNRETWEMQIGDIVAPLPSYGVRGFWNDIEKLVRYFVITRQNLMQDLGL